MKKSELIEQLAPLPDDAEILLAIITPKDEDEDGFELGAEGANAEPDEDDDTVDNEDGTVTNFEPISHVEVLENEDPDNNAKEKFGAIVIDMVGDDEDEEGEGEGDNNDADGDNVVVKD